MVSTAFDVFYLYEISSFESRYWWKFLSFTMFPPTATIYTLTSRIENS